MGLDMYLKCNSKRVCKEAWEGDDEGEFFVPRGVAIYWRKANAIHRWFVQNVQGGNDDCGSYEVSVEDLCRLHDACVDVLDSTVLVQDGTIEVYDLKQSKMVDYPRMVLKDTTVAEELLPTRDGFFFGDTDYDGYYWDDVAHTRDAIERLFKNLKPDGWRQVHKDEPDWYVEFRYESSW